MSGHIAVEVRRRLFYVHVKLDGELVHVASWCTPSSSTDAIADAKMAACYETLEWWLDRSGVDLNTMQVDSLQVEATQDTELREAFAF